MIVYLLMAVTQDQYDTTAVFGGYTTPELAEDARKKVQRWQAYVQSLLLDQEPKEAR